MDGLIKIEKRRKDSSAKSLLSEGVILCQIDSFGYLWLFKDNTYLSSASKPGYILGFG